MKEISLPVPFGYFFSAVSCVLGNICFILLQPTVKDVKLSVHIKRIKSVEDKLGKPCILVTNTMNCTQRRQYIKNKVCFIVPERQIYLPIMGTYLTECRLNERKEVKALSPSATLALLYHLQKESLEGRSFGDMAKMLGYPAKTISVICSQLADSGLCKIVTHGEKRKSISFLYKGKELWEAALPLIKSPIQRVGYVNPDRLSSEEFAIAGDDALAYYTMMAGTDQHCYAMDKKSELAKRLTHIMVDTDYEGSVRIELWKYNPLALSDSQYVDPLSLALCYAGNEDERVQGEINRLIDKML